VLERLLRSTSEAGKGDLRLSGWRESYVNARNSSLSTKQSSSALYLSRQGKTIAFHKQEGDFMRKVLDIRHLLIGLTLLLATSTAFAQATRTWVSGFGDDANPCSRTAPCKTFAGAISKTAAGGTINALDPGGFGAVTITKALTIEAVGTVASALVSAGNGINVNAGVNDAVTLRGITVEGLSTGASGIKFNSGARLTVERCVIQGFSVAGIDFEPSAASHLVVTDTTVNNSTANGPGVLIQGLGATPTVTLERARIVQNLGFGVLVKNGNVAIRNSTISGNATGVRANSSTTTAQVSVDDSIVSDNTVAGVSTFGSTTNLVISRSTISNNLVGISGVVTSFGDNRIFNNGTDGAPTGGPLPLH
jgi:hypothetical protein